MGAIRAVHWTLDPQQADIIAGLLHAEGIHAFVLNREQVALNWFDILGLGGFFVCLPLAQLERGRVVMRDWRAGAYALDDPDDRHCPHCHQRTLEADPRPRGWAIILWLVTSMPLWWPKRHERCTQCGRRHRGPNSARQGVASR